MTKAELREKYKQLRNALSDVEIQSKSAAIAKNIMKLDIWNKTYFHVFMPIENLKEVDTSFIFKMLQDKNKQIVASKSNFQTMEMEHFLVNEKTVFAKNKFNISEPVKATLIDVQKIDVVFVPLLAFDNAGHRVGYGKGFYDKFLSKCRQDCVFIGLSFFQPENKIEDINENDFKLKYIIIPNQILYF